MLATPCPAPLFPTGTITFLFTDIEGSTRLWEQDREQMSAALAGHDALARATVEGQRGTIVKMTGDGVCAAFVDPTDALNATLILQRALADPTTTNGVALRVRCGLHAGIVERRDKDYFGPPVNRAARIMAAAHGGQVLLSQAVVDCVREILPAEISLRDLGNVRLKDLATPEHVYQLVHPDLRQEFPALRSLEATPNNLPQQVTSFVGRERAQAEVRQLMTTTRLVTLIGLGGLGKTRLSLQVGAEQLDDYPDGVWFVELAPLADERLVAQVVASVLGVKEEAGRPVREALLNCVGNRQLLLILDNCEHLVHACAEIVKDLLQSGPRVKVLASSREPLRVRGETTYPLSTLSIPDPQQSTIAGLLQFEAVRLFADRAAAVRPGFQVTSENATAVAEICRHLDGIPLAIELAAARIRALPVETIAERLFDRFRLLTDGDTTALRRQQTLRACIDWSYDLLTEPERVLLRRLAVFAGGWTLGAAEAVGADGEVNASDVLNLLCHLVEKSLVEFDTECGRYRFLETVRQYARERLDESSDGDQTRTRHLAFYVALTEEATPKLNGPEQGAWLARLDLERENLLSAHRWCDSAEEGAELGLRLISAAQVYWPRCGLVETGYRIAVTALARPGADLRTLLRSRALGVAGTLAFYMGRHRESQVLVEESLVIARETGDKARVARLLALLGIAYSVGGDRATARRYLEQSLVLLREGADQQQVAVALSALAEVRFAEGDLDAAEPLYEEALAHCREHGDSANIAVSLLNLAMVSIGRDSATRARAMVLEAHANIEKTGSKRSGRYMLGVLAGLAAYLGEWTRAARFYGAGEEQGKKMGLHHPPADEAFLAPLIVRTRDALGAAAFAVAEASGRACSYEDALAEARLWLENPS
jgi:predicted ATPase/class 3 adenylate cyclase